MDHGAVGRPALRVDVKPAKEQVQWTLSSCAVTLRVLCVLCTVMPSLPGQEPTWRSLTAILQRRGTRNRGISPHALGETIITEMCLIFEMGPSACSCTR